MWFSNSYSDIMGFPDPGVNTHQILVFEKGEGSPKRCCQWQCLVDSVCSFVGLVETEWFGFYALTFCCTQASRNLASQALLFSARALQRPRSWQWCERGCSTIWSSERCGRSCTGDCPLTTLWGLLPTCNMPPVAHTHSVYIHQLMFLVSPSLQEPGVPPPIGEGPHGSWPE